ncbi:MAG: 2-oxo acid dehydrogenase subunit E2 [Micropruina sp.]|nr:2-oxo acid dehydrogenase subunit E2 [Micropruina sp.]
MVPNIKGANRMNLVQLAQALSEMVQVAKLGKVQPADMAQGTFTITNVGVFRGGRGTPILNVGSRRSCAWARFRGDPGWSARVRTSGSSRAGVHYLADLRPPPGRRGDRLKFLNDVATMLEEPRPGADVLEDPPDEARPGSAGGRCPNFALVGGCEGYIRVEGRISPCFSESGDR